MKAPCHYVTFSRPSNPERAVALLVGTTTPAASGGSWIKFLTAYDDTLLRDDELYAEVAHAFERACSATMEESPPRRSNFVEGVLTATVHNLAPRLQASTIRELFPMEAPLPSLSVLAQQLAELFGISVSPEDFASCVEIDADD